MYDELPRNSGQYASIDASDANRDGFSDVELNDDQYTYMRYGHTTGLAMDTRPWGMSGWPSARGDDGKFLTLAVKPSASLGIPDYWFRVATKHDKDVPQGELHLEVFDGDLSGSHDTVVAGATARTCYALYADADQDYQPDGAVLVQQDDTHFVDNAWTAVVDNPPGAAPTYEFPDALVVGSTIADGPRYGYLLHTWLTTGSCADATPTYPDQDPVANALKVRANGDVEFFTSVDPNNGIAQSITIRASDSVGVYAALDTCTPATCSAVELQDVDTTYDGEWAFGYDLGVASDAWFAEADADSLLDPEVGNATGADGEIGFEIYDLNNPNPPLLQPLHPSGQYDSNEPCAMYHVNAPPGGLVGWYWYGVGTHNNIWLAPPLLAQPTGCLDYTPAASQFASQPAAQATETVPVITFPMFAQRAPTRVAHTTASPEAFWIAASAEARVASLLPIELGTAAPGAGKVVKVKKAGDALTIASNYAAAH